MNIYKSKEFTEKLYNEEVITEAIEGIYMTKDELPEEVSVLLLDIKDEYEYLVYLNPIARDKVVCNIIGNGKEILLSYLIDEVGRIEAIYRDFNEV